MVNLTGHEAGNGGHSQGTPTAHRAFLYSEALIWTWRVIWPFVEFIEFQLTCGVHKTTVSLVPQSSFLTFLMISRLAFSGPGPSPTGERIRFVSASALKEYNYE
jgi:hypothetical protein